jgi:hypothetical protein
MTTVSLAERYRSLPKRAVAVAAAVLAIALPALAGAASEASPKRIPLDSDWIGTQDGWEWVASPAEIRSTTNGGRRWEPIFQGGDFLFSPFGRTSRNTGVVATGRIAGSAFWTNDRGRDWFLLDAIPLGATTAGSGNGLFWHERGDTLYRVEGWPPRGDFPCDEVPSEFGGPLPGHRFCRKVDDGLRSVVALRLPGSTFHAYRGLVTVPAGRGLPAGVAALVDDLPHPRGGGGRGRGFVVVRGGGLGLARLLPLPALRPGEEFAYSTLFAAWPRVYVDVPLMNASPIPGGATRSGSVLMRSRNGGENWATFVARSLPRRAPHVPGSADLGARFDLPGGWIAAGRAHGRLVVVIRQLDRTRGPLAFAGSAKCGALRPVVDWPSVVVEGRRGTQLRAVWLSSDGGYRWTGFGRC